MPTYRVTSSTLALLREDGHHVAHTVPKGAIISIENGKVFDGDKLMEVVWAGVTVMMFTQNLRERTTEVK